jgi:putative endonuclease
MNASAPDRAPALKAAISYLEGIGFQVRDHDWNQPDGTLDIAAIDRGTFVACVLRIGAGGRYGTPLEAIGDAGARRQRRLAVRWLSEHGTRFDQVRVDVIGVLPDASGGFTTEHVRGVA